MNYGKKIKLNSNNYFLILTITIFLIFPLFVSAATSPDAIGIRVAFNSEHLSPTAWYKKNIKLQGSPQALVVDGYEAVRDGRTVYVNAANVAGGAFYTNIYIISYNQEAASQTIDIFGQILMHWKFNVNLDGAKKLLVIKDTRRLADLAQIKQNLLDNKKNGKFPPLSAGSYLAQKSISVWPSWQETLGKDLGATLPVDPVNQLGACPGYDKITCWNQEQKKFAGNIPAGLPSGSKAYIYSAGGNGASFRLCAITESGFLDNLYCLTN